MRKITPMLFSRTLQQLNDDSKISENTKGMVACATRNEESHT